jgi:hypothetical protein
MGLPTVITVAMLPIFVAMGFVIGSIGGYAGYLIYQKIKNKPLIRQFGS